MEIFYNTVDPNYIQVRDMGPKWLAEFREMDANYRYAGWTLDLMAYWLEQIVLNQFPEYCDLNTLRKYEKLFRIEVDSGASIEDRRAEVMAYFYGVQKICMSTIKEIVRAYTGMECKVYFDNTKLMIYVLSPEDNEYRSQKLSKYLARRLPVHLDYALKYYKHYESEADLKAGTAVTGIEIIETSSIMKDTSISVLKLDTAVTGVSISGIVTTGE